MPSLSLRITNVPNVKVSTLPAGRHVDVGGSRHCSAPAPIRRAVPCSSPTTTQARSPCSARQGPQGTLRLLPVRRSRRRRRLDRTARGGHIKQRAMTAQAVMMRLRFLAQLARVPTFSPARPAPARSSASYSMPAPTSPRSSSSSAILRSPPPSGTTAARKIPSGAPPSCCTCSTPAPPAGRWWPAHRGGLCRDRSASARPRTEPRRLKKEDVGRKHGRRDRLRGGCPGAGSPTDRQPAGQRWVAFPAILVSPPTPAGFISGPLPVAQGRVEPAAVIVVYCSG